MLDLTIRPALRSDGMALSILFADIVADLEQGHNDCGWSRAYPTAEDAELSIKQGSVYLAEANGKLAGSVQLNHHQETAYEAAPWKTHGDGKQILVIHTLAVHPDYRKQGIARALLANADLVAAQRHCVAIRLDVYEKNLPAQRLYESFGYQYVSTVDLGLGAYGLKWFRLYERPVLAGAIKLFK